MIAVGMGFDWVCAPNSWARLRLGCARHLARAPAAGDANCASRGKWPRCNLSAQPGVQESGPRVERDALCVRDKAWLEAVANHAKKNSGGVGLSLSFEANATLFVLCECMHQRACTRVHMRVRTGSTWGI